MPSLTNLLEAIKNCDACSLMSENTALNIRYVPILPKPEARFMFIGRDPSPRTAEIVGIRESNSVFIKEIFKIVERAGLLDNAIYITDLCKCHWRTSVGTPLPGTEDRPSKLDKSVAETCLSKWLKREIEILRPRLIVAFGEELYQIMRQYITDPVLAPKNLSAKADKSIPDAEAWFVQNGPFTLKIGNQELKAAFLRHAGNSTRLPQSTNVDKRLQFYEASKEQLVQLLRGGHS